MDREGWMEGGGRVGESQTWGGYGERINSKGESF